MRELKLHKSIRLRKSDQELITLLYGTIQQWIDDSVKRVHMRKRRQASKEDPGTRGDA